MSAPKELNELAERKRWLVLQADLQRTLIKAECVRLHSRLDSARETARLASPWLLAAGAVAGLLAVKQRRHLARWISTALAAGRWLRELGVG